MRSFPEFYAEIKALAHTHPRDEYGVIRIPAEEYQQLMNEMPPAIRFRDGALDEKGIEHVKVGFDGYLIGPRLD